MSKFVPITTAANAPDVLITTLRRWVESISFPSARLYGSRSHRNRRLIEGVERAVRETQCS